jgi:hypothetical protein
MLKEPINSSIKPAKIYTEKIASIKEAIRDDCNPDKLALNPPISLECRGSVRRVTFQYKNEKKFLRVNHRQ